MKRVLIVDDQVGVQMLLQEIFNRDGYQVELGQDGFEAIEKAAEYLPDLMVMDMQMPHMNGIEAAEEILSQNPQQKIILMTAFGQDEIEHKAGQMGIKACIQKPFDVFKFLELANILIGKKNF